MFPIRLGVDRETNERVFLNADLLRTHLHLLGATGSGKTTALKTILKPLLRDCNPKNALVLIDPMGNLSREVLMWMASEFCPEEARRRLLYLEPAREELSVPFNPLLHFSEEHRYYQVGRAVEIVLRGWQSQNIQEMPRLRRWAFASFTAAAMLGFPIATCRWLLQPGVPEHKPFLARLPAELQAQWNELLQSRGGQALNTLDSTRNRLSLFFESGVLRRMFGFMNNRFDAKQFIRDRRIVIVNLGQFGRLDPHIGHTIGSFIVNEVLQAAMNLTPREVNPSYLVLDEFQNFVSPDLFDAIPTVRQMGLRLLLAHQSLSQLEKGEIDMTQLIWQARSRLLFANDAEDADQIAHELATLTYDPYQLKEILYSYRQRVAGQHKEILNHFGETSSESEGSEIGRSNSAARNLVETRPPHEFDPTRSRGQTESSGTNRSEKKMTSHGTSSGGGETFVTDYEDFYEVSKKEYFDFNEQTVKWAQNVRRRKTGQAYGKFRDDDRVYDLDIEDSTLRETPELQRRYDELLARNFASQLFATREDAEREEQLVRDKLLSQPPIVLDARAARRLPAGQIPAPPNTNSAVPSECPLM